MNATVTVAVGDRPTQLQVTVSSTVQNAIAGSFTNSFTTITRSATADYNGPAPMGSPCNTFGNEPAGTSNAGPIGSQLTIPPGGASCSTNPQFWGSIDGPSIYKVDGDQIMTRACSGSEDGCSGGVNQEFRPRGYFYIIRVADAAVGLPLTVQIYDPAYVYTGQQCESKPGTPSTNNMNTYANTDAIARYRTSSDRQRILQRRHPADLGVGRRHPDDHLVRHAVTGGHLHPDGRPADARLRQAVPGLRAPQRHAQRAELDRTPPTTSGWPRSSTSGCRCAPSPRPRLG